MKILIFAGGTGPVALQQGLFQTFERELDGLDIKIIVNAYDNGLSTGAVRRVFGGQILGPSDVRKNHTTRLRLIDSQSPWLEFLEHRFSCETATARLHCEYVVQTLRDKLQIQDRDTAGCDALLEGIDAFFNVGMAHSISYDDFSIANVVYAGLAAQNEYSLRRAASIMAAAIGVPDNVLLNDDESLFLGALTRSGRRISDEGEIVTWANEADPIVDAFFVDAKGQESLPELCLEAWQAILEANLIVLSSGTQWSSLVPTYASHGFTSAIRESKAEVLMVMNREPDKDALGQSASDIINVLVPRYFDANRVHVLTDRNSHPDLRDLTPSAMCKVASLSQADLSDPADPPDKHNPAKLAHAVGQCFFRDYLDSDAFVFDYDDTLVGRKNEYPKSSRYNVNAIRRLNRLTTVSVCTGNSINALCLREHQPSMTVAPVGSEDKPLLVFADGGVNQYLYDDRAQCDAQSVGITANECVAPSVLLTADRCASVRQILNCLSRVGIAASLVENRGDAVIAIKPIDAEKRPVVVSLVRFLMLSFGLEVRETGRTTVEIRHPKLSKSFALRRLNTLNPGRNITYVGDECESGNDSDVATLASEHTGLRCLRVKNPAHTALFISTLLRRFADDGKR